MSMEGYLFDHSLYNIIASDINTKENIENGKKGTF